MKATPTIYLDSNTCSGDHIGGWQNALEHNGQGLPPATAIIQALDPAVFEAKQATLFIEDALLFPLRIQLDQPAKPRELTDFLKWKLKRLLPYPIEQVLVRHLPLSEENSYLTFSLPAPWIQTLHDHFQKQGTRLGYIGGLFSACLENAAKMRGGINVAFFSDNYLIAELDSKGGYQRFHSRRIPFDALGSVDVDTILRVDLLPILEQSNNPIRLLNLAPNWEDDFQDLAERASALLANSSILETAGDTLSRFHMAMQTKAKAVTA